MAEALPEIEALTETDPSDTDLPETFERAATHLQTLFSRLDTKTILSLYGLYKQATVGPCDIPQPGWFQMQNRQKWDAWKQLKDMPSQAAMKTYVDKISELDPDWLGSASKAPGWVAVSSMPDTDDVINDEDKTVFDWVREGNIDKVLQTGQKAAVNDLDSEGMGLIHWAADRGNAEIVCCLLVRLGADVNLRDSEGQTALHYAAGCGHGEIVRLLVANKADKEAVDQSGSIPLELATESDIVEMLKGD